MYLQNCLGSGPQAYGEESLQDGHESLQDGQEDLQDGQESLQGDQESLQGGQENHQGGQENHQGGQESLQGGDEGLGPFTTVELSWDGMASEVVGTDRHNKQLNINVLVPCARSAFYNIQFAIKYCAWLICFVKKRNIDDIMMKN